MDKQLKNITNLNYYDVLKRIIIYLRKNKELYDVSVNGQFYIYAIIIKTLESLMKKFRYGVPIKGSNIFFIINNIKCI